MFIFLYYVLYLLERKIFPCQSFLRKNNKILVITFLFFSLCSLLFPVCVCVNCFVFLEIKNTKTEYFLIRVSLADLGSIE